MTLERLDEHQFVRSLHEAMGLPDRKYALFIGAGCSVSSGIPGAGTLVDRVWLPALRRQSTEKHLKLSTWVRRRLPAYNPDDPGGSFGDMLDKLFGAKNEMRQQEIESLCSGKTPGFGYAMLAKLIAKYDRFNIVLTTNFDDLVADAFYLLTEARPVLITDASLARYICPTSSRPLIIKLHGDHRLAPIVSDGRADSAENELWKQVGALLSERGLIFIGYGGRDQDVARNLDRLSLPHLKWGVYWVNPEPPRPALMPWLQAHRAEWVRIRSFDEFMLRVKHEFGLDHPDPHHFERMVMGNYMSTYGRLARTPALAGPGQSLDSALKGAFHDSVGNLPPSYWTALFMASRDRSGAREIYDEALSSYPRSAPLHWAYASFLAHRIGDHDQAEKHYQEALAIDSHDPDGQVAYTQFLVRRERDAEAKELLKEACAGHPKHAGVFREYAVVLEREGNRCAAKAGQPDSGRTDSRQSSNWATAHLTRKREVAEDDARRCYDQAEEFYERALRQEPDNPETLGLYANFLATVRQDRKTARRCFKAAMGLDALSATNLRNYANILPNGDHLAERLFQSAIDSDPDDVTAREDYAAFLNKVRPHDAMIAALFEQVLEMNPHHVEAFDFYRKAFECSRDDVHARTQYAGGLLGQGYLCEGLEVLAPLLASPTRSIPATRRDLRAKCWFYALVYRPSRQRTAMRVLNRIMKTEPVLHGHSLDVHLRSAAAMNHPLGHLLPVLRDVLTGKEGDLYAHAEWWAAMCPPRKAVRRVAASVRTPQDLEGCS